ncbi:hypothetical protein [Mariprofundus ferrinatatus]|nr:hypothetical protein [Mariprofundus ferrinatatus]
MNSSSTLKVVSEESDNASPFLLRSELITHFIYSRHRLALSAAVP